MAYAGSSGRRESATAGRAERGEGSSAGSGRSAAAEEHPGRAGARAATRAGAAASERAGESGARARGRPFDRHFELPHVDWRRAGGFGAGLVIGALIGASTAILLAPQSGEDTRRLLRQRGRRGAHRASIVWDDLGEELRFAGERAGRKLRRKATRGRWQAEDLMERVRPPRRRRAAEV